MEEKAQTKINTKKPKWMKILEKQSWQAELVVSGAAIFGALQLPDAIKNLIDYSIYNASGHIMTILQFLFLYLFATSTVLIINFIIHFVLRALWIGMLGLVSVYPNGINPDFKTYSKDYNQKLQNEFPDINQFNRKLDNLCSSIFAITALATMMFLSILSIVVIIGLIAHLINMAFPSLNFDAIFGFAFVLLLIPAILQSVLHLKRFQEKAWVKRIHFPVYKWYSKITANIFYEPVNYIQMTLFTNSGYMKSTLFGFFYMFIIGILGGFSITDSNIFLLENGDFKNHKNRSTNWTASLYENTIPKGTKLFGPTIQSDQIKDDEIKLFIPRFAREEIYVDSICTEEWNYNDDISETENENKKWRIRLDCHNRYYQILMNDSLLQNLKLYNYKHPNANEKGFITHIPSSICKKGKNEIVIKLGYKFPKTNENKQYRIPFRYFSE